MASALPQDALRKLRSFGKVDLIVGVPSFNCAHTVNYVLYQAAQGLAKYFSDKKALIMLSDGGSSDGTINVANSIKLPGDLQVFATQYVGVPGKGTALKAVFEAVRTLDAEAMVMVDSDLRSITPEWIKLLFSPLLEDSGLVTPFYMRHKYDGTITNLLCYPFTRALYGKRVRQPIGGDFGLSRGLVDALLESKLWETPYVPRFGIDIFIIHTALSSGFTVKEAVLGTKIHEAKDPAEHLAPMFRQVAGSMFSCTEEYEKSWRNIQGSSLVERVKDSIHHSVPEELEVNPKKLVQSFTQSLQAVESQLTNVLGDDFVQSLATRARSIDEFGFPVERWPEAVYLFAAAFKSEKGIHERERLLEALRVLWMGRVAWFVIETVEGTDEEAEMKIEREAAAFERFKPFLVEKFQRLHEGRQD